MGDSLQNFLSGGQSGAYSGEANSFNNIIPMLQQYAQQGQNALSPFQSAGANAIPGYQNLINNIQGMSNGNWVQNYTQSPYAKMLTSNTLNSMNNAAAATGTLGSGANQTQNGQVANQIASSDMQNFYNDQMGLNQQALQGYGNLMGAGEQAGQGMANMSGQLGANIAAMLQEAAKANAQGQMSGQSGKDSGLMSALAGMVGGGGSGPGNGADSSGAVNNYLFGG